MPVLAFIQPDGERQQVDAVIGESVMRAAVGHAVAGIPAECGGHIACGTCHVYVSSQAEALLPPPEFMETEMLGFAAEGAKENSRLSCQLIVSEALDGAEFQIGRAHV